MSCLRCYPHVAVKPKLAMLAAGLAEVMPTNRVPELNGPSLGRSLAINLMMTLKLQADFVRELPEVFLSIRGGWGTDGNDLHSPSAIERGCAGAALGTAWKQKDTQAKKTDRTKSASRS